MSATSGITITGTKTAQQDQILTPDAVAFLAELHRKFEGERQTRLAARKERQAKLGTSGMLDFAPETKSVREGDWKVGSIPKDMQDRRVEITGPVDRKMVINALNSGAKMFMADFEDASAPTWDNMVEGQANLRDAIAGTIGYSDPASGKSYALGEKTAVLMARPRGWHLNEAHVLVDGTPISGSLFDFGLYFYHNAKTLLAKGSGPYFYLPKLEHYLEARLWNDVFKYAQERLGVPQGSCKATVLIETLPGAFHAEEILYELKDHIVALNCGRWDYIFSFIKVHSKNPAMVLPDRAIVAMTVPFMKAYALHVIKVCHKRGAFAMGGMAAQIPVKNDEAANAAAFAKVRADKEREASEGHDGTWVAHPALVPVAMEVFDRLMPNPNQVARQRQDVHTTAADLQAAFKGDITEAGVRGNITVAIRYLAAWLGGSGAVPIFNLMEDAATAEISRTQLWQWRVHGAAMNDGRKLSAELLETFFAEELAKIKEEFGAETFASGRFEDASNILRSLVFDEELADFLTLPAYQQLLKQGD